MTVNELLDSLRFDGEFMRNVAAWERLPARQPRHAPYPSLLNRRLVDLVERMGLAPLYTHQAQAIEAALSHQNVVIVTGTASGKSLAYHLPTLQTALGDPLATALYLFPTRALAQDQAASLSGLVEQLDAGKTIPFNIYDGDTPQGQRTRIRQESRIIISNPDMLHMGILPYHTRWDRFFANLRVVVLDEMHTYRGIFGSHMANVLRRLRRICQFHGSDPVFICASATIANPVELAERLLESPVALVDEDGSPGGEKHVILYNPPVVNEQLGIRRSYALETSALAGRFLASNIQTIVFARARLTTEVLLGYIRDALASQRQEAGRVHGYRGGYLPLERREIEKGLRDGEILGVVATNALELGIDIGSLSASILAGYPGTIASTWQQIGRAGRRVDTSVGIMIGSASALDQYIMTHPRYLFERSPEQAMINPDNLAILVNHLRCAVFELPFRKGEAFGGFTDAEAVLSVLAEDGEVHASATDYRWVAGAYPAATVGLRTGGSNTIVIQDISGSAPRVIGEIDRESAPILVYRGAVYLHEGTQYLIETLDWENGTAYARPADVDYYTSASSSTDIHVEEELETDMVGDCVKTHGRVLVTNQASSFRIIRRYTHETLGFGQIDLPAQQFETTAYWVSLTPDLTTQLEEAAILLRPNDYGPNWQEQRARARSRDGYRCTRCRAPERDERQHDVHHVRPFRDFGYVPGENTAYLEANQVDNLLTLCKSCHREVETATGTRSALSGLANILQNLAAFMLMCSPNDIGVISEHRSAHTRTPTITVYDNAPGGLGFSLRLYELHDDILPRALELVRDCPCQDGCPACVGPLGEVSADTKRLTTALIEAMINSSAQTV